ncbi:methyltransferase domain-containing protein [Mycolicibacterium tusciae]|uniref:methyltransferase domain-containing protein n=1 Tax=Mycolicibacterium tusciae TaxID=75922 RepID=UPI00024A5083
MRLSHANRAMSPQPIPDSGIGEVLVSSRSLAEYRAMFALSDTDLRAVILDCPGGAASATAEINAAGGNARAVDPLYGRGLTTVQLAGLTQAETDRGNAYVRAHPEQYRWTFFTDADHHHSSRSQAGQRFARDYEDNPGHYIAAQLPDLPFPSGAFDLVLSSHLLFSYADRLTPQFHRDAIAELVRLARVEVRIFPLVAMGSLPYDLDRLLHALRPVGITSRVIDVDYEFQAGGNQMLVCTPKEDEVSRL